MSSTVMSAKQTSKNNSLANTENDSSSQTRKNRGSNSTPILKKSNKTAHAFGPAYFHSVKEAVFEIPYAPFLPQTIPEALRLPDYQSETFHSCLQCKDSFRFSSTLEEHMSRRSWILGYWCQSCFQGKCDHVPMHSPMCGNCVSAQYNRRTYLRSRGMKKGQKAAIIQIFYNQCEFFNHLKQHNVSTVEINELMLMPLPWDIKQEEHSKLEKACKAIMEYAFLNRIHIMEFLRDHKVDGKWWDPPVIDENTNNYQLPLSLSIIIQTFRENDFSDSVNRKLPSPNKNPSANSKAPCIPVPANNIPVRYCNSPYRPPTDIAFVDCGPSHSVYKSNTLLSPPTLSPLTAPKNSSQTNESSATKSNANSSSESKELDSSGRRRNAFGQFIKQSTQASQQSSIPVPMSTTSNKVYTVSTNTNATGPKISVKKFASEPVSKWAQCPENKTSNAKILTVHSEKCLDISSIISQLPPDVINSKKIVFIEHNSNQINQYQKNSPQNLPPGPTLSANCVKVNVPPRKNQKSPQSQLAASRTQLVTQQIFKTKPTSKTPQEPKIRPSLTPIASKNPQNVKIQPYDGKVFFQSGKKFLIKQTNKLKPSAISTSVLKPTTQVRQVPNAYDLSISKTKKLLKSVTNSSPLTPSTSPSELSTSSCESLSKLFDDDLSLLRPYDNVKSRSDFNLKNISENEEARLTIKFVASKLYLHLFETLPSVKNTRNSLMKYKQNLLDTLPYLRTKDIQKRIDHINHLSKDFLKAMKLTDDKIIDDHERFIALLTDSVEQAKILNIPQNIDDVSLQHVFETQHESDNKFLDNWKSQPMQKCPQCAKLKKPKNYLPGFSKLSDNEGLYCQCYNCFCSKCNNHQGTLPRFIAHCNYHSKTAPFACPDCYRKFPTFQEVEKHIWLECFHPLMKNWFFGCKVCGIDGLTTLEALTQHFLLMHSKRGYVCSDCKAISFLESDYQNHLTMEHDAMLKDENQLEMVEVIMCKIGNCIVLKENYTKHLIDHVGVEHQIFHKCPFCPFTKRHAPQFVMEEFREHVMTNHRLLLSRFATKDIINQVQKALKVKNTNQEVLPMIINTRTIAREAFEKGATQYDDANRGLSSIPMIVDVRSEAANLNTNHNDTMPKIREVKSIANDSLLKKSQGSRKRKANTVIEITLSPKKISSVEIKNGGVDNNDKKVAKSRVKGLSQMKELLLEKRSLTGGEQSSTDVEIIELEKTSDGDKAAPAKPSSVAKTPNDNNNKDVCKNDKFQTVRNDKEGANISEIVEAAEDKEDTRKIDEESEKDEKNKINNHKDVSKGRGDNTSRISTNGEKFDSVLTEQHSNKGGEEQEITTDSEYPKISRESTDRIRENLPKTKEIRSNVCLNEGNQDDEQSQNLQQRELDANQRGEGNEVEGNVHREEEVNPEKETNKIGYGSQEKEEKQEGEANLLGEQEKNRQEKGNQEESTREKSSQEKDRKEGKGKGDNQKEDDQETDGVSQQNTDDSKRKPIVDKRKSNVCVDDESFIGDPEEVCENTASSDDDDDDNDIISKDNFCKGSICKENVCKGNISKGNILCKDDSTKDNSIIKNNISRDSSSSICDNSTKNNISGDSSSKNIIRDDSSNSKYDIIISDDGFRIIKDGNCTRKDGTSISKNSINNKTSIYVNKDKININKDTTNDKPNTSTEHKNKEDDHGSSIKNNFHKDSNKCDKIMRTEFNRQSSANEADRVSNTPMEIIDKCKNPNPLIPITENLGTNPEDKNEKDKPDDPKNLNSTPRDTAIGKTLNNLNRDFFQQANNINKNLNDHENVIKDNENFLRDNTTVIKDRLAVIEQVSSIGDNEDINDNNIATANYSRVTNKSNELILRHNNESLLNKQGDDILPKNNFSIQQFFTKDKEFSTIETSGSKNLNTHLQCSIKSKSLQENESSEDRFPPIDCQSSNDSQYSQEINLRDSETITDEQSNTQSSIDLQQTDLSVRNAADKNKEQSQNTFSGEKNLLESEENSKEVNDLSALEDLKAKMSRTFKSLAKRMEATTTTLQQECSKSLPIFKGFKNIENGSKFLNEARTRTRQKRRRRNDNWQKLTSEVYENITERILYEDDSSNSSDVITYQRGNIRLADDQFKEDFKIEITQPPPPLARIPQHILKNHSITKIQSTQLVRKRKQSRIAFNGPLNYEETVLDFKCHICSKLIDSSWPVLKAHFDIWHPDEYKFAELNPQLLKISSDYIDGGYKEILSKKFKCDASPRKRKRRNRFTPKSPEKIDQKSIGICVKAESVLEDDDGMFKCRKCEMKFIDMDLLRQHISKSHRIKGRYLVCLECGENFVVAPSLQMHLKAFHAIDDPLTYLLQNTSFAPENLEDTEEEEEEVTADENQCYVCMAVFENKAAVDKHLRVHGMAFLNRKRMEAKKNLNITEKKFKTTTETDDARCGSASITLNPTKHQDDKQILAANSLETEVSVH